MHKQKEKGDLGVAYAISAITEQGWTVSLPISEHKKYDLIAEKDGICKRIQVRYTTPVNGVLRVKLRSIWSDKKGVHFVKRKSGDFDILAIFNPQSRETCFVNDNDFLNETAISIRTEETKNCQIKGIRMFSDFKLIKNM